jgi:zinc-binding alcohol dehydrogenase family protein
LLRQTSDVRPGRNAIVPKLSVGPASVRSMAFDFQVTVGSTEPHALADQWAEALGWHVGHSDKAFIRRMIAEGHASDEGTTTHNGVLAWRARAAVRHPETPQNGPPRRIPVPVRAGGQARQEPDPPGRWSTRSSSSSVVGMTGMLSGSSIVPDFEPVAAISFGTKLTVFHGDGHAGAAGAAALRRIVDGVARGDYPAHLGRVFTLGEIVEAHRHQEGNRAAGKVVVLTG